jgi:hypothetical protein
MLGHHVLVNKIRRQKDMNKWIMHLKKELILGHSRDVLFLREETYGDTERIIGTWFKKQEEEKRFSLLK